MAASLFLVSGIAAGQAPAPAEPTQTVTSLPASGRSYELLFPPGKTAESAGMPVVIYLHPSGEPQLDRAKRDYWPILSARKCLMVLPLGKSRKMWLAGEDGYVLDVLADVQARYAVDAKRVILLGVAGGGQLALFLADRLPDKFRAVIAVSTNPVVVRGQRHEWFYPDRAAAKRCPYFVVNHITQGSALMYWRQVQSKLAPAGASISILPVTGKVEDYLPPPKELGPWLDEVLAGSQPKPLADPQQAAVAKMFAPCLAELPKAIEVCLAAPAGQAVGQSITKEGKVLALSLRAPAEFQRSAGEETADSTAAPLTQIRLEHGKWPIYLRCEARATEKPMQEVLAAEEAATVQRGLLYQLYHTASLPAGGRTWKLRIGSTTYPDRRRGWVSTLFLHASAPVAADPRQWLTVLLLDETQQPDAKELAGILATALTSVSAQPSAKGQ